jgi:hypothetical protein
LTFGICLDDRRPLAAAADSGSTDEVMLPDEGGLVAAPPMPVPKSAVTAAMAALETLIARMWLF